MKNDVETTKKLTNRQMSIITDRSFPRYLTAGPGTGKTEVLVSKIIYLLENDSAVSGLKMEQFAVITFTNKAADEMKDRLSARLYDKGLSLSGGGFEVSTIHSFCSRLLRKHGSEIGLFPNFRIKSYDKELNKLIESALASAREPLFDGIPKYRLHFIIRDILRECYNHGTVLSMDYLTPNKKGEFRPTVGIGADSTARYGGSGDDDIWVMLEAPLLRICIDVYNKLEKIKREERALTLNDLITRTAELLGNKHVLKTVAGQYKYLFIDEFQDTNRSQLDIVRIFIGAGAKVFLIGDEKQSIYGFRGADIDCSKEAKELVSSYHSHEGFYINENFRTDQPLLEKINEVFDKSFAYKSERLAFPQVALEKTEELRNLQGANENPFRIVYEADIVDIIEGLTKETLNGAPINYEDIFILCRTNNEAWQISTELRLRGTPHGAAFGRRDFAKKEIIDTYKLFNAVLFKNEAAMKELIFTDYYYALKKSDKNHSFRLFMKELDLVFREEEIQGILEHIYQKSKIIDYYRFTKNDDSVANLLKLKSSAGGILSGEHVSALDFFDYLEKMTETVTSTEEEDYEYSKEKGKVALMTIHKAKGLSLPIVIIPNIDRPLIRKNMASDYVIDRNNKSFALGSILRRYKPSSKYLTLLKEKIVRNLEEELRVLYVALTRAEHILVMTSKKSKVEIEKELKDDEAVNWARWL